MNNLNLLQYETDFERGVALKQLMLKIYCEKEGGCDRQSIVHF